MKERLRLKEKLPMLEFHNRLTTWKFFFVLSIRHFNFVEYFPFQNILCLIFMLSMRVGKLILFDRILLYNEFGTTHTFTFQPICIILMEIIHVQRFRK